MKLSSLLGVLLVAGVVSAAGCKKEQESLIVVALTADSGAINLRTLTLSAQSPSAPGGSKTFSINGLSASAVSYGLYVPGDVIGDVTVTAVATDPASCVGYSGKTTPAIRIASAGSIAPAAITLRAINTCQDDGGAGTSGQAGSSGRGGGSGTTGSAGTSGAAGAPPSLATCNEYYLHAASTCTLGDIDDIEITSLAFSPDGRYLVTGASGAAKVWTFSGNTPVAEGHVLAGTGFAVVGFSSTGLLAVGWQGSVELWNTSNWTRQQTLTLTNQAYDVGFSPDGQQVISIDFNSTTLLGNLYVHSIGAAAALQKTALTTLPWALSVSPVAAAGGALAAVSDQSGQVSVYTVSATAISSPTVLTATSGFTAYAVRFSPDGTLLASGGASDGLVHFWNVPLTSAAFVAPDLDVTSGTSGTSDDIYAVAFSPNSRFITVAAGFFGSLTSWNVPTPRGMLDVNTNPSWDMSTIAVSPSGSMIAAGESDCGIVMICGN